MDAVIRLKRRFTEEPQNTILVNCKKAKTESIDNTENVSAIIKLAATVENQEESLKHVNKLTKTELQEQYKKHTVNVHDKLKQENKQFAKFNRYKIVNLHRFKHENQDNKVAIVDVETENKDEEQENVGCVYDLYYANLDGLDTKDDLTHDDLTVVACDDANWFDWNDNPDMEDTDDSDSNAENNWRNDYPDEIDEEDVTDEDILKAMQQVDLDGDRELSSDDGEEGYVYGIDSVGAGFEEDIDPTDVMRYGEMFARFKARIKNSEELGGASKESWYCEDDLNHSE